MQLPIHPPIPAEPLIDLPPSEYEKELAFFRARHRAIARFRCKRRLLRLGLRRLRTILRRIRQR
jgi:hypothetical protein